MSSYVDYIFILSLVYMEKALLLVFIIIMNGWIG